MECNFQMERILISIVLDEVIPNERYQVFLAHTLDGDPFWYVDNFCGLDTKQVIQYGKELTELEWDGNELFFSGKDVVKQTFSVYRSIRTQLLENYPSVEFDLMVSVNSAEETATVRFWAVRKGYHTR